MRHIVRTMRGDTRSLVLQREGKEEDKRRVGNITFRIYVGNMKRLFFFEYILRNVWEMQGHVDGLCCRCAKNRPLHIQNPIALIKGDTRSRSSAKKEENEDKSVAHLFVTRLQIRRGDGSLNANTHRGIPKIPKHFF